MKSAVIVFLLYLVSLDIKAQEVFIPYGKITFEKKVNLARAFENTDLPDEAKEKMQKYIISNWEFYFAQNKSLYKPAKKDIDNSNTSFFTLPNYKQNNEIYTDFNHNKRILKRNILEDDYLLTDTIPKLEWKIMHDVRNIAGYECRKAIGVIYDTIYVVAFYTDELLLRGGPEGFTGLPGTILGLAIPRYNTTWFATKVSAFENHLPEIVPANTGKKVETDKDLKKLIELYTRYDLDKKGKTNEAMKKLYGYTL